MLHQDMHKRIAQCGKNHVNEDLLIVELNNVLSVLLKRCSQTETVLPNVQILESCQTAKKLV